MINFVMARTEEVAPEFAKLGIPARMLEIIKKRKPYSYSQSCLGRFLASKLAKIPAKDIGYFLTSSLDSFYSKKYDFFWSISHKDNWLAAIVAHKPTGIDVEINREKNPDLFALFTDREWRVIGEKNWANFYKAWTAKESFIKAAALRLENLHETVIIGKEKDGLLLDYAGRKITAKTFCKGALTLAISLQTL